MPTDFLSICHRSAQYLVVTNRAKYFSLFIRFPGYMSDSLFQADPKDWPTSYQ